MGRCGDPTGRCNDTAGRCIVTAGRCSDPAGPCDDPAARRCDDPPQLATRATHSANEGPHVGAAEIRQLATRTVAATRRRPRPLVRGTVVWRQQQPPRNDRCGPFRCQKTRCPPRWRNWPWQPLGAQGGPVEPTVLQLNSATLAATVNETVLLFLLLLLLLFIFLFLFFLSFNVSTFLDSWEFYGSIKGYNALS